MKHSGTRKDDQAAQQSKERIPMAGGSKKSVHQEPAGGAPNTHPHPHPATQNLWLGNSSPGSELGYIGLTSKL